LDLRYNGGGLIAVGAHLASLIAGEGAAGEAVAELEYNDKHQDENQRYLMENLANSVNVERVAVITTSASASASEMIINGLRPHVDVATIGGTTFGKPVGQNGFEFCEEDILRPVTFNV